MAGEVGEILGPWKAYPNLNTAEFDIRKRGDGTYVAVRKVAVAAPAAAPAAPPAPSAPQMNWNGQFNSLDGVAQGEISDNKLRYGGIRDSATRAYDMWMKNYPVQQSRINRDTDLDVQGRQNNAAARGMYRSGNRVEQELRAKAIGGDKLNDLEADRRNQDFTKTQTISQANTDEAIGNNTSYRASAQRAIDDWNRKYGAGTYV